MISKLCFTFTIFTTVVFVIACNNQNTSNDNKVSDSTSNDIATTHSNIAFDDSRGVTKISPDLYKQLADTLNVRVLQGTYKPGDSSIMHAHPDFDLYVLEPGTVELTGEDGNKQNVEFKKDMAVVLLY